MMKTASAAGSTPAPSGTDRSDDGSAVTPAAPRLRTYAKEVAAGAGGVALLMLAMETAKQLLLPDLSPWGSHIITIFFSAAAAGLAGSIVLRRVSRLQVRLVDEADQRRRIAEEAARANGLLLATLESNRDGVLVVGLDDSILTFNRQFLDMWQMPESVLQGPTRELMRHAKAQLSNPDVLAASVAALRTRNDAETTDVLAFKDGRIVELVAAPQRVEGVVVGRVWRCRDVTAHRRAQRHSEMLAQTIRSVSECVSVTDMEDRIIFVNQAFLETYRFEQSDLLGQHVAVLRSDKTPESVARQILPATLQGGWSGELWNRRKDGTDFESFLSTSIVRDETGAPLALVGVARDITDQKRTEAALALGRESERIVTLAAGIAHEFNNQMQTVLASTALALEDLPPDSSARDPLQLVVHAGERAANLTGQLLAYAGRGAFVRMVALDLNDEIRERATFCRALIPPGATFVLDLSADTAPIRADRQQIRQVITSLATNAAEAMANRQGLVSVRTRVEDITATDARRWIGGERPAPGRFVCLSVFDQGIGMPAETIAHIFDPFFSTKFRGRGMGLPAVLGIARASGGTIAVESVPTKGTSVTVAFPFHPASQQGVSAA